MPINDETFCKRMVKRVTNAIHNPASSSKDVKEAILELKHNHILVYKADIDDWVNEAINVGNERKVKAVLRCFGEPCQNILISLLKYSVHTIPRYISSKMFNSENAYSTLQDFLTYSNHYGHSDPSMALNLVFRQPKMASTILRFVENKWFTKDQQTNFININPVLAKRKKQRKILMRFWLLTTKKVLGMWRENLYIPGTGALYKKALKSFNTV